MLVKVKNKKNVFQKASSIARYEDSSFIDLFYDEYEIWFW